MSVVSRRIYFVIFASLLSVLSACSDSGSGTPATVDSRLKNFDTPYAIDEGLEGVNSTLDITFTSTVTGTLSYASFNVSAAAKSDYTAVSGQLEVVEGNEYTVSVTVFGDSEIEGNEKFGLTLSFDGEELETYYGLIINDDLPGISISTTSVLEGDSGTSLLPFTFTLEEEVVDPYTFQLSTPVVDAAENNAEAGTFYAIPGVDFEAVDQTITFKAGQTDITINVVVNADNVLELDELVYLQLNSNTSATGTIITDDSVDDQGFDLYSTNDSDAQDEGSPSAANPDEIFWQKVVYPITVENPGNIIDSQTVQISLQKGTSNISWADPGLDQDYCANNPEESEGQAVCETVNSYTLEHGTETFDVEFYVRADSDVEDSEEIEIQLQNDQGIIFNQFRHTITQDDVPSILFSYDTGSTTLDSEKLSDFLGASKVIEISEPENGTGDTRELILDFKLEYAVDSNIEYDYEFKGIRVTGTREFDYSVTSNGNSNTGTLNLSDSGDQNITLSLTISDDDEYEGREELQLSIDGIGTIPIIIVDNDLPSLEITTSSGENVAPVSYDNINTSFNAIDIPEQGTYSATAEASVASHEFSLTLSGDAQALEDLAFSFDQTDLFDTNDIFFVNGTSEIADAFSCDYLALENRKATLKGNESQGDDFDYRVLINNGSGEVELGEGTAYSFPKGENKLDLVIEVNDDIAVECLEFLSLKFSLSPAAQSNGLISESNGLISESTVNFQIDNKDKAVLTVTGFTGEEGSSDVTPTPRNSNNQFQLGLSQPINTKVTYSLAPSDDYSCNNDDIDNLTGSSELTFSDVVQENYITVDIPQDNLVEPDEVCQIAVTNYDSSIVDVSSGLTAQGVIENDDFLTVSLASTSLNSISEPLDSNAILSVGTLLWSNPIAENMSELSLLIESDACSSTSTVDCVENSDLSDSNKNAYTASVEFTIKDGAAQIAIPEDQSRDIPLYVIGDDIVENTELLKVKVSVHSGSDYFLNDEDINFDKQILNEDKVNLVISGSNIQAEPNDSATKPYTISWDKEFDLFEEALPEVTIAVQPCTESADLHCLESGSDYVIDSDESSVRLENGASTSLAMNYFSISPDTLVEFSEELGFNLVTSSPYVESVKHIGASGDADDITGLLTVESGLHSLDWDLTVNSDDTLTVSISDPVTSIEEVCDTGANPDCMSKKLGALIVTGTIAQNGPTITLNVANTCSIDENNTNNCAIETSNASANDSERDFEFTSGQGSHTVHTYGQPYSWTDTDITLDISDDDWVEVEENIKLAYTATEGSGFIASLPSVQNISVISDDVTTVTIERSDDSSCTFETGKANATSFTEANCHNLVSHYDLKVSHSIAKEVPDLNVALKNSGSANLIFKKLEADTFGFDVEAKVNSVFETPDANNNLYLPIHTQNTQTDKAAFSSDIIFTYLDDAISESNEDLTFSLIKSTVSPLYTVPLNGDTLVFTETILNDDSINVWLSASHSGQQEVTEGNSGSTAVTYTLNWDDTIPQSLSSLIFDLKLVEGSSALFNDDYTITTARVPASAEPSRVTISGSTLVINTNGADVPAGSETIEFEISGDELVEIDEVISATLAITDSDTGIVAAIGGSNIPVNISIPNEDTLTVSVFSVGSVAEGDHLHTDITQPFTYTLDKNIAAEVPTIELYLDASTCDSNSVNCAEYEKLEPVPEGNDFSFGAIKDTQILTLHTGPTVNADGETVSAATAVIDSGTAQPIVFDIPLTYTVDERVEAHESLVIEFNKGDDISANTNLAGRDYIKTIVNGSVAPPVDPVNLLSMEAVIENDDKFNLSLTASDDSCALTIEADETACEYVLSWFDMESVKDSTVNASELETALDTVIIETNTQATSTQTVTDNTSQLYTNNKWDVTTEMAAANAALSSAETSETNAQDAIDKAEIAISNAQIAQGQAVTFVALTAANNAISTAQSAKSLAAKAKELAIAAQSSASAAKNALKKAKKAPGITSTDRDDAIEAGEDATEQAEAAVVMADSAILTANTATQLAETTTDYSYGTLSGPVVDSDAGEISLGMVLSGTTSNTEIQVSDADATVKDPQDYKIEFEDSSGGAATEQSSDKIVLKASNTAMSNLPRTLTLTLRDDNFMEPEETIGMTLSQIASSDNHEYIETFSGFTYSSTISANDTATITLSQATPVTAGNEGDDTDPVIKYAVALTGVIAKNTPNITLSADPEPAVDGKVDGVTAADSTDYSISSLKVHEEGKETLSFNSTLDLTINSDNTLELDELIKLNLAVSDATLAGIDVLNYTIENDDAIVINITSATSIEEGTTADSASALTKSNSPITYTLNSTNSGAQNDEVIVAANYPAIILSHAVKGTVENADYTELEDVNIHTIGTEKSNGFSTIQNLSIVNDRIIEKDEIINITFSENVADADDVTIKVNTANLSELDFIINNDDYINVRFQCGGITCDGTLTEISGSEEVEVLIDNAYTTQGLDLDDRKLSLIVAAVSGSASSNDYVFTTVTLPESNNVAAHNYPRSFSNNTIITIENDDAIELNETLNTEQASSAYVSIGNTITAFTIISEDVFTVNPLTTQKVSLHDGTQTYNLQVCKPGSEATQGGALELTTTLKQVTNGAGDVIDTVSNLTCDDIDLPSDTSCQESIEGNIAQITSTLSKLDTEAIPECSGATPSTTYNEIPLFTLKAQEHAHANKWFEITDVTADERCAAGSCVATADSADVVLLNNQLTSILDSGLTKCLEHGLSSKWAVDCATVSIGYLKQDAAQTNRETSANLYPDLAYTYVDENGLPVTSKPSSGEVCVQDNNTGFIWSGTILDSGANTRVYSELADITDHEDYDCDLANGTATWQLPTVQDLLSIMDVEKLKASREFGIRFTDQVNQNVDGVPQFYKGLLDEHSARYWTSVQCDADSHYALNFLNGELTCELNTEMNSIMTIYK